MPIRADQHVLELEVAVNHAVRVDVGKPLAQVVIPLPDRLLVHRSRLDIGEKLHLAAFVQDKIHNEIRLGARLIRPEVRHLHDPRMVEPSEKPPLDRKPLLDLRIVLLIGEKLERMPRAEPRVLHLVDLAHSALAQKTDDFIRTDCPALFAHTLNSNFKCPITFTNFGRWSGTSTITDLPASGNISIETFWFFVAMPGLYHYSRINGTLPWPNPIPRILIRQ